MYHQGYKPTGPFCINIYCDPEKSDNLFMDMMFIIGVARKDDGIFNMNLQSDKYYEPFIKKYTCFYYVECPKDTNISINDIKRLFDKSIDLNDKSFFTHGKFNDIKFVIDTLWKNLTPITINLSNHDNLRNAINNNLCNEIKRKLAHTFGYGVAEKLFITISQDEINKQVSQLLIDSKPPLAQDSKLSCMIEENIKNAASKLLIDWTPSFVGLMIKSFIH